MEPTEPCKNLDILVKSECTISYDLLDNILQDYMTKMKVNEEKTGIKRSFIMFSTPLTCHMVKEFAYC